MKCDDNQAENGFFDIPPDPMGAAGTSRLFAVVTSMIEVRTKGGDLVFRDGLRDFFAAVGAIGAREIPRKRKQLALHGSKIRSAC